MDLPKILLTGLVFLLFLVFLEFLGSKKNEKTNPEWTYPRFFSQDCFFVFFGFPRVFGQLGLGQQKPREKPNKPKKPKNQSWMDLPKILLTGLFFLGFLVFLEFLDSWAWDSKNLEKNQINQKNQKKSWMDLPKILLTGLFFLVFFGFPRVFGQLGLGQQKPREKPNTPKKTKKTNPEWTYPRFFSQDCFFVFLFFLVFLEFLDSWGLGHQKTSRKTMKTKKTKKQSGIDLLQILLTGLFFCFFLVFLDFLDIWKGGNEKRVKTWKNKRCKNPTLPASLSESKIQAFLAGFWEFWI